MKSLVLSKINLKIKVKQGDFLYRPFFSLFSLIFFLFCFFIIRYDFHFRSKIFANLTANWKTRVPTRPDNEIINHHGNYITHADTYSRHAKNSFTEASNSSWLLRCRERRKWPWMCRNNNTKEPRPDYMLGQTSARFWEFISACYCVVLLRRTCFLRTYNWSFCDTMSYIRSSRWEHRLTSMV